LVSMTPQTISDLTPRRVETRQLSRHPEPSRRQRRRIAEGGSCGNSHPISGIVNLTQKTYTLVQ
jgi:hypothetical protein